MGILTKPKREFFPEGRESARSRRPPNRLRAGNGVFFPPSDRYSIHTWDPPDEESGHAPRGGPVT